MTLPILDLPSTHSATFIDALTIVGDIFVLSLQSLSDLSPLDNFLSQYPSLTNYWVFPQDATSLANVKTLIDVLDAGADKIVVPAEILLENAGDFVDNIPLERLAASIVYNSHDDINNNALEQVTKKFSGLVSGYVLRVETGENASAELPTLLLKNLESFAKLAHANLLPSGGQSKIGVILPPGFSCSLKAIQQLSEISINVILPAENLTTDVTSQQLSSPKLNIADALSCRLITDRADGLFTTVVVDEWGIALGVVYSSKESIRESVKTGKGVYQSRKRGLWYKGATSGAVQELRKIQIDCDGDALRFIVKQHGSGFCHFNTRTCFGSDTGLTALENTLVSRKSSAPAGSYTQRLFQNPDLLTSKIMEEADELCKATTKHDIAWEAADLIYFALTKCVANDVSLADVEKQLDKRAKKITRRPGNAKPKWDMSKKNYDSGIASNANEKQESSPVATTSNIAATIPTKIKMQNLSLSEIDQKKRATLLLRPIVKSDDIMAKVRPIVENVRKTGDAAVLDLTAKFDGVHLTSPVISAPFSAEAMALDENTRAAIDQAYDNIYKFHEAQHDRSTLVVETMPGVVCSRFSRPIEKVGLYVPGGTAILPSTALMLGIPAKVAGCKKIIFATPPRKDGTVVPEVLYVAHKIGAEKVVLAGGAQAVAALAYGTESVPKVDKICGPGNQYVTAAKMFVQNDSSAMVSIDMPAGPSELLVIADSTSNPAYVASDLLSQAEHGVDSQVSLLAVSLTSDHLAAIEREVHEQASCLPRVDIVRESISKSFILQVESMEDAIKFANDYAPEHLILHLEKAEQWLDRIENAGSVFVGSWSPESCGDYASGTNHTLPTYGYARMYSGVNTQTFLKHITAQQLTRKGLNMLGDTVMRLAEVEELEAHRNAVAVRIKDIRSS